MSQEENSRYFLPVRYQSRARPEYYDDSTAPKEDVIWQPNVYRYANGLARAHGLSHVVDVGCGTGRKLAACAPEFQIIGIDFGDNLAACREKFPQGAWLEADLEEDAPLPVDEEILPRSVIICADVIEHLVRPELLLGNLRALLDRAPFLVLSTPDRRMVGRWNHQGPPDNPHHVREWTYHEMKKLLAASGFTVLDGGWTQTVDEAPFCGTSLFVLGKGARNDFRPVDDCLHRNPVRRSLDIVRAVRHRKLQQPPRSV